MLFYGQVIYDIAVTIDALYGTQPYVQPTILPPTSEHDATMVSRVSSA